MNKINFRQALFILLCICSTGIFAQGWPNATRPGINKEQVATSNDCSRKSPEFKKYSDPAFYIPKEGDPDKVIKVNFNVFRDGKGQNNFGQNATDSVRLKNVFFFFNEFYLNEHWPSDPIPGVVDLKHTFIHFELNAIYFYEDSTSLYSVNGNQLLQKIKNADPSRLKQFNICFTEGKLGSAAGITTAMPDYNFTEDMCIIMMNIYNKGSNTGDYARATTMAHEMGHALGLDHTYMGGGANVFCARDSTDKDFLDDVFGKWPGNCPHFVTDATHPWGFDVTLSKNDRRTNNLMGGFQLSSYLSPKQIGMLHRSLSLKTTRRYVTNCPRLPNDMIITGNEIWDFDFRVYSNIVIKPGASLTIRCSASLPDSAKIFISRKAKLIVDGGKITGSCNQWQGLEFQKNKWWQLFAGSKKKRLIVKNNGSIEKTDLKGLNLSQTQ